jgi:hypothetical protein
MKKKIQIVESSNIDLNANVDLFAEMESLEESNIFKIKLKDNKSNVISKSGKYKTDLGLKLLKDTEGSTSLTIKINFLFGQSYI